MSAHFDEAAEQYDSAFTNTFAGKGQRHRVWKFLKKRLATFPYKLHVLELNCGTGEDACFLTSEGHGVWATDISPKMIARAKAKAESIPNPPRFEVVDINHLQCDELFDLVFSNFGGLNCLSPAQLLSLNERLQKLLNEEGFFAAVMMSRKCFWERLYYWFKKNPEAKNRRLSKDPLPIVVDGTSVPTWFYSPEEFATFFPALVVESVKPIGIGFPPSYLNPLFDKYSVLRIFARTVEFLFGNFSFLSNHADHFLIIFRKR